MNLKKVLFIIVLWYRRYKNDIAWFKFISFYGENLVFN